MWDEVLKLFHSFFEMPFKVALISYYYPLERTVNNGNAMHTYYLSRNLAELGCEVHVFASGDYDRIIKERVGKGKLIIHSIKIPSDFNVESRVILTRLKYIAFENKVLNNLFMENSRRKFDIVHTQCWLTSAAFILRHFSNAKWVHTFHCLEKRRLESMTAEEQRALKITGWIESTVVDAEKLIAVSSKSRQDIVKEISGIKDKTVVIPNGVALELFKPSRKLPPSVLYIGRFSKEKGIEMVPKIARAVLEDSKKNKFVAVAGKNHLPELKYVEDEFMALRKQYGERFTWVSQMVSKEEIVKMYGLAGVYVQPSFYENAPLCVLEAMASGKAIVATNVGGIPEVVGNSGILVEPDAKKISKSVIKLLGSESLRRKYANLALERVKMFDWSRIAKKTLELYHELVKEKRN